MCRRAGAPRHPPGRWLGMETVHPLLWPQPPAAPGSSPGKERESPEPAEKQNPCVTTPSCKSSPADHVGTAGKEPWEPEHASSSQPLYAFCILCSL